ncbi:hypothetical protein CGJ97_23400, partial [Vibrio parahaemolyticus]|uniref:hypothetical protein n=2 Tax=Vibrio TaxID=662 RepID=UPI001172ADB0
INRAKSASTPNKDPIEEKYKNLLVKERTLKNKYRTERNALKKQLQKAEGEKLELIYQLYHTQKYLSQFEKDGIIPTNILEFPRVNRESSH